MPLSLVVNEVCFDEEPVSLIRMRNQQKIKALLNGTDGAMWSNGQQCRVLVVPLTLVLDTVI